MAHTLEEGMAPLQELEHALMPFVTFVVMPVFAFVNAGVILGGESLAALTGPVGLGVALGLFVGKQVGVLGFSWLAVILGLAELPKGIARRHIHGISVLAGIGFTMSLFVMSLGFSDVMHQEAAKLGILAGSIVSGAVGSVILLSIPEPNAR